MHELSIAVSLVSLATRALTDADETRPVLAVRIAVGDLSGVVPESLEFAWDVATEDTPLEGARLDIQRVMPRVRCPRCETETILATPPRFACAACGERTSDIVAGKELDLVSIELDDEDEQPTDDAPTVHTRKDAPHAAAHP